MSSDSAQSALPSSTSTSEPTTVAAASNTLKDGAQHLEDTASEVATIETTEPASDASVADASVDAIVDEPIVDDSPADLPPEVLTPEIVGFLVREVPQKALWKWLGEDERLWLQQRMTRGFQNTIRALRQPAVRTRLVDHLQREANDFKAVLQLWAQSTPPLEVIAAVGALPDDLDWADEQSARRSFSILRRFEIPAISLALVSSQRRAILQSWLSTIAAAPDRDPNSDPDADVALHEYSYNAKTDDFDAAQKLLREVETSSDAELALDDAKCIAAQRIEEKREAETKRAREEAARWRHQAGLARTEATAARSVLETRELQSRRETQEFQSRLAQESRRGALAEAAFLEAQKTLDRTSRRLKQSEKSSEELAAEVKRLKRQVRQSQQLHEELKKQLSSTTAKLQETQREMQSQEAQRSATIRAASRSAAPRKTYSSPSISTSPLVAGASANSDYFQSMRRGEAKADAPALLDQPFLWRGENRVFRVSAREVRRAVDRNDETFVFALIQGLDALREADARLHRVFLDRVRQTGRYYGRVLTTDTTRVLVDASNVARFEKNARGKGELTHLLAMRDELRRRDCFPIIMVADASLKHHIDDPEELLAMAKRGELEISPAGTEADEYLAREARRSGAYVVSNDRTFHLKVAPDWEPLRINFRIHDGYVLLDEF